MYRKIKLLINRKWKETLRLWLIFPIITMCYIIAYQLGYANKDMSVPSLIDDMLTGLINVESANAVIVSIPAICLIFWVVHTMYALPRQERVYLRKVFEILMSPLFKVFILASGISTSSMLLNRFSDIHQIESYTDSAVTAFVFLFVALALRYGIRHAYNSMLTNKSS